jgi:hypothetical protein
VIRLRICEPLETRRINASAVAILGYAGRDPSAVERHIRELAAAGVPRPKTVPVLFAVTPDRLSQDGAIRVASPHTSGEAEFVLVADANGDLFVTVGSDHTDRELERTDIPASKQVCPKVLGRAGWRFSEVADHWDSLELRSWIDGPTPYQEGRLSEIITPHDILDIVGRRLGGPMVNLVIFSGTLPLLTPTFVSSDRFRAEISDPIKGRHLSIEYTVQQSFGWATDG